MITASFGSTNLTSDVEYEELTKKFKSVEICTKQLCKDVRQCINHLNEDIICSEVLSELLNQYHQGTLNNEIYQFCKVRTIVKIQFLQDLELCVKKRVEKPLSDLVAFLEGPAILITKRYHKMLDYNVAISRNEKYKENKNVNIISIIISASIWFEIMFLLL